MENEAKRKTANIQEYQIECYNSMVSEWFESSSILHQTQFRPESIP